MKIEEKLAEQIEATERELEKILRQEESLLFQAMRYAVFPGGKRFRPLLVLASGECFEVEQSVLLPFACALELIHNYSLIHDDLPLMDDDDYRRGKHSCHKAYGEDVALLAGDALLTLAFEVMAEARLPDRYLLQKERVIKMISQAAGVEGMIGGQFLDITFSPESADEEQVLDLILKKTGSLIIAAVKTGAIFGSATALELGAVIEYGKMIGLAFQIKDDIQDSTRQDEKKSSSKPNYVALFGLERAKSRLDEFVHSGIRALSEASLHSEELRYLALKLLEFC